MSNKKRVYITRVHTKLVNEGSVLYASADKKRSINCDEDLALLVRPFLDGLDRETMIAVHVNTRLEPLAVETIAVGTLSSIEIHPREVFKGAILNNAASIFLAHNHPAGSLEPSTLDTETTKRLQDAGELLGIKLLDHIIVTQNSYSSLKKMGLM